MSGRETGVEGRSGKNAIIRVWRRVGRRSGKNAIVRASRREERRRVRAPDGEGGKKEKKGEAEEKE